MSYFSNLTWRRDLRRDHNCATRCQIYVRENVFIRRCSIHVYSARQLIQITRRTAYLTSRWRIARLLMVCVIIDACEIRDRGRPRELDKGNLMPSVHRSDGSLKNLPFALGYTISRGKLRSEAHSCARARVYVPYRTHRCWCPRIQRFLGVAMTRLGKMRDAYLTLALFTQLSAQSRRYWRIEGIVKPWLMHFFFSFGKFLY